MSNDRKRMAEAKASFIHLMAWTCVVGVLMSIAVVIYLYFAAGPLTAPMVLASVFGVLVSVILGAGLMALGFLSSNSGHDDNAAGHHDRNQPADR